MPMEKIGFRRRVTDLGILIIGLLAVAFILGILSLKRTMVEAILADTGAEGAMGTTFFVEFQPEYAAAPAQA